MMTDIVNIGFAVNTGQIEKGYKRLDKMGDAAEKAEGKIAKMAKGVKAAGAAVAGMATAGTAAAAAIIALMNHLANVERELQASARMAGMTANQFEAMSFAYRQFGLTVEQVNDIYKDSRERVGEWLSSQSGALQDFGDVMGMSKDEITAFAKEVDGLTGQQLLQRMVDDMQAAGASANEMSFALEGMASEATRMIPALENNGKAVNNLKDEYNQFNAAFSLDKEEVKNYADLAKNFDLFLDTAQNGITKVLAPLAGHMAALANATTHFLSSLKEGSESALSDRLVEINEEIDNLNEAIEDNQSIGGRLKNSLFGFVDGTSTDSDFLSKKVEELKKERKKIQEELSEIRFGTKGLIDTSKPLEIVVKTDIKPEVKKPKTPRDKKTFAEMYGGTDTVDLFALNQAKEYDKWIESISTTSTKIADLRAEIEKTQVAVKAGDIRSDVGQEYINDLQAQLKSLELNPFDSMTSGAKDALSAMSEMFESGSKDAKKLAIAMQAVNLAQSISAVLNQAQGDPYTAAPRMAAMASIVAGLTGLSMSIAGLSGGFDDVAGKAQEQQGLDTWGNKSESIADATEITADATKKLVGINTDMLEALQNLGTALASAAGLVIRGNETPQINRDKLTFDYADIQSIFEPLGIEKLIMDPLGLFGKTINKLFGGSSKVVNEGIRIVGGSLTDLIDDVLVQSFQTVQYKKWKFGSKKSKTQFANLGEDVSAQVSLVLGSIAESVSAGASQLGIAATDIESRINAFNLATTDISLMGLSAEEQQKEIQAVFSKIFDNLAGDVVPFIDEFQKVGEALGETLARVATQTSIAEVMIERFGVVFGDKMADPKAFAQAADNISNLVGGVDKLAELTSSFTDAFATDQQKFDIYQSALLEQLSEIGLSLPSTTSGFYDLMKGLDATTESGQEQIAALLGLTDTASSYYSLLEKMTDKYRDAASAMYDMDEATRGLSLNAALTAARMGDFSLADNLNLSSIAPQQSDFSSAFEYNLARAETAAKLNELADLQSGQVTVQDKQLSVLEQIRDKIAGSDSGVKEAIQSLENKMTKLQNEANLYLQTMDQASRARLA